MAEYDPSRAELEAWLWSYKHNEATETKVREDLLEYLKERDVTVTDVGRISADIHTYANWPFKEEVNAEG